VIGWGGGALWTASWTESSDGSVELARMQQRPGQGRFQFGCARFWSQAGHVEASACRASVSRLCTFDAVQNGVRCEGNGRVHARERVARSRRPQRACGMVRAGAVEGPTAGVVGWHWLGDEGSVLGVLWRGSSSWLTVEAWASNGVLPVGVGVREGER
jgi:hypothetical protein